MQFPNRREAGRILADRLTRYHDSADTLILALPRGGVPVAFEVAQALRAPLDVFIVRKLGFPGHEEYAMGAIASGNVTVFNPDINRYDLPEAAVSAVMDRERIELQRREQLYRGERHAPVLDGRTVILVDDGIATGTTMKAAIQAIKLSNAARIIVAVPVAPASTCVELQSLVDEVVCVTTPDPFHAVGLWYRDFTQTSDQDVRVLLETAQHPAPINPTF